MPLLHLHQKLQADLDKFTFSLATCQIEAFPPSGCPMSLPGLGISYNLTDGKVVSPCVCPMTSGLWGTVPKIQEYWGVFEDRNFLSELGSQEPPSHSEQFLPLKFKGFTDNGGRVVDRGLL